MGGGVVLKYVSNAHISIITSIFISYRTISAGLGVGRDLCCLFAKKKHLNVQPCWRAKWAHTGGIVWGQFSHAQQSVCRRVGWKNPQPANHPAAPRAARWLAAAEQRRKSTEHGDSPREVPNSTRLCKTHIAISSPALRSYLCIWRLGGDAAVVSKQ